MVLHRQDREEASAAQAADAPLLQLRGIQKRFPGVLALDDVSFDVKAGEVHVLFGENGAGKSTMISMIAGVYQPTAGQILFKDKPVELDSVHHARAMGISAVFQEFSLVEQFTVEQNLFLGAEQTRYGLLNRRALHSEAERILQELGFPLKASQKVAYLSRAEQQMVEIAKAFRSELSVLILDEPTASLTERETDRLFELVEKVKAQGVAVIYITHRMAEIKRIGDRITVLRDGRFIKTVPAQTSTEDDLVRLMTGRVIDQIFPDISSTPGEVMLSIDNLSTADGRVDGVTIEARRGEIIGLAGLVGAGKSKLLRACFGLEDVAGGSVVFDGEEVTGKSTRDMLNRGFFYNPPDRRAEGLVMVRSCRENITLASLDTPSFQRGGFLNLGHEARKAQHLAEQLQLHPLRVEREVDHFSGGNQQKVLLAKCLSRDVKLYVFDEPTVGVDVGTRVEIYKFIADLCRAGAAVVLVSSDLPEILHLTHRAYVMHRGKLQVELTGDEITQETILKHFFDQEAA
ncbi:sugar ABC transporter ATP-binding protein [Rhodovibrionaceae bacterium A322]